MQQPVTQLLAKWRDGNERAFAQLSSLLYNELRALAHRHLRRERAEHTIQKDRTRARGLRALGRAAVRRLTESRARMHPMPASSR